MRRGKQPAGPRHVLKLEAKELSQKDRIQLCAQAEKVRKAGNDLTGIMQGRLKQLENSKRYRRLLKLYAKAKTQKERKQISVSLEDERKKHRVTWEDCRAAMIPIGKKYGIHSVFALTKAEDIWEGVEAVLFRNGHRLHFARRGQLPPLRAKQSNRGVIVKQSGHNLMIRVGEQTFRVRGTDQFEKDELGRILDHMSGKSGGLRVCFGAVVCRKIRGKIRVYVHFTLEGLPEAKYDRFGNLRHVPASGGVVGADIGTQSLAWMSDTEAGLKNLADRCGGQDAFDQKMELLLQKMDRSRRAMNPQNYNPDGSIRPGPKKWKKSRRYLNLQEQYRNLCRKRAASRKYSVREDANHMRTLGNVFVTERKNAAALSRRAKNITYRKDGRPNRKKRFGRSVQNRSPGAFQEAVKQRFERSGGIYMEVSADYRASQYDHTTQMYTKKSLGTRMYRLGSGDLVQRDMHAAFNLYCCAEDGSLDQHKANRTFADYLSMQNACITRIRREGSDIKNSGIV